MEETAEYFVLFFFNTRVNESKTISVKVQTVTYFSNFKIMKTGTIQVQKERGLYYTCLLIIVIIVATVYYVLIAR